MLKAHHLPLAHLYTPTPPQLLSGTYNPDTHYKALWWSMYSSFLCVFSGSHVHDVWHSEPEHISSTNLVPGFKVPETKHMAQLKPMILWLRVQCLKHSANMANGPPYVTPSDMYPLATCNP